MKPITWTEIDNIIQSSRRFVEETIRKSKEGCTSCGKRLPWVGRCPCQDGFKSQKGR